MNPHQKLSVIEESDVSASPDDSPNHQRKANEADNEESLSTSMKQASVNGTESDMEEADEVWEDARDGTESTNDEGDIA